MNKSIVVEKRKPILSMFLLLIGIAIAVLMVIIWNRYSISNLLSTVQHK